MRQRGLLVVLSGPAGSGKSTLAEDAVARHPDICRAITATTRKPRTGEQDGRDYFFLTRDAFEERIKQNRFAEYAEFNGQLYGTPLDELDRLLGDGKVVLLVIEVQGARLIRKAYPHAYFTFVLPPTRSVLGQRLSNRGTECVSDIERRLKIAESEIDALEEYDALVINDDRDAAVTDLLAILTSARAHAIRGGEREAWLAGAYKNWHASGRDGE